MSVQITYFLATLRSQGFLHAGLQGVGALQLAAGLWWRPQAVQEAVPQVGVASGQVVGQELHVHLIELLVQQPVQHRVGHGLQL